MTPDIFWISEIAPLRLAQMPRPRAGDWLPGEIAGWRRAGIGTVVSLLEAHEVESLALQDEPLLCANEGIDFLPMPIADRGSPQSLTETLGLVDEVAARLQRAEGVGIHCRAGIGRSGLVCACVLLRLGVPFAQVFPMLSRARGLAVPDTALQIEWTQRFATIVAARAQN